jgi:hypothetical protein
MSYEPVPGDWQPYDAPKAPGGWQENATPRHSGLGIASFALALFVGIGEFVLVATAGYMTAQQGGMDPQSGVAVVLGLLMIGGLLLAFLGVALGFASLFQGGRRRVFGILGLLFNGLILLGVIGLILIGISFQTAQRPPAVGGQAAASPGLPLGGPARIS